jgi:hypothetical protein
MDFEKIKMKHLTTYLSMVYRNFPSGRRRWQVGKLASWRVKKLDEFLVKLYQILCSGTGTVDSRVIDNDSVVV